MTSLSAKTTQHVPGIKGADRSTDDLFAQFAAGEGDGDRASGALPGGEDADDGLAWVQERQRLRAALEAVNLELQQDTGAAIAALEHLVLELSQAGALQRPEIQAEVDCVNNLMQGIHQGLGGYISDSLREHFEEIRQYMQRVSQHIRQATNSTQVMQLAVGAVRQFLGVERSLIYRFEGGDRGLVICESLDLGWTPMQGENLPPLSFGLNHQRDYQTQPVIILNEVAQTATTPYHRQLIERFQIQASVAVPLFLKDKLWGLLVAQQCQQPRQWREATDVNFMVQLGHQVGLALQQALLYQQQDEWLQQSKLTAKIVERILQRRGIQDLCDTTVRDMRHFMRADRVGIFQFSPNSGYDDGTFIAEDVNPAYPSALAAKVHDHCFGSQFSDQYQQGRIQAVADIYNANLSDCHISILSDFAIRANLIVPLHQGSQLWGLLCVHQCSGPRIWKETEIELLKQIASQFMIAFQQIEAAQRLEEQFEREQAINHIVSKIRQTADLESVFTTTTYELRRVLGIERVTIYKFRSDFFGDFVMESNTGGFPNLVGSGWEDPYLNEHQGGRFRDNLPLVVDDIYEGEILWENGHLNLQAPRIPMTDCHVEALEYYQARSCAVVAIFKGRELWGLLSAFQNTQPRHWQQDEVTLLMQIATQLGVAIQQTDYVQQIQTQSHQISKQVERVTNYSQVISQISQRLMDRIQRQDRNLEPFLASTTYDVRHALKADRVAIYRFAPDWSGEFIVEDYLPHWPRLVGTDMSWVRDLHLQETQGGRYRHGESFRVDNIYQAGHAPCHLELLEHWQAKAYMIAPIFKGDILWGLLGAYQNSDFRHWEDAEMQLLNQTGAQLGNALFQVEILEQLQKRNHQIAQANEQERDISRIINKLRQTLKPEQIFQTTVSELRRLLQVSRCVVYQFHPDWSGEVVAESVSVGFLSLMQEQGMDPTLKAALTHDDRCTIKTYGAPGRIDVDTYLQDTKGGAYSQGELYRRVDDVEQAGFAPCYLEVLEKIQAKAYICAPIFLKGQLWGLVLVYQCDRPRSWAEMDVNAVLRITPQLGAALEQAEYIRQVEEQTQQLQAAAEREKAANQQLQAQIIQMLTAVRPALQGDLTVRAPITEDAVGTVADAYNNTIQALRKLVVQVKEATEQVRATSEVNGEAIAHLSQQTQQELSQVTRALQRLEEMVQATETVTQNAQRMEAAVQRANETVQTGDNAMNLTVEGILAIRQTVSETTKKIKRLSESSQKISKVVNLISNFTTQTQLLALNAAIEATRAGEYGRGFAVVADEVRSLAQQSSEATGEIEALVQEIQTETNGVSAAMDLGIQQVVEGTSLVNQTRQSLNEIVTATAQIRDLIQGITASAQAQVQQSNAVTQAMEDVAAIARKTSTDSVDIATSFQSLVQTAEVLQRSVDQFKVS